MAVVAHHALFSTEPEDDHPDVRNDPGKVSAEEERQLDQVEAHKGVPEPICAWRLSGLVVHVRKVGRVGCRRGGGEKTRVQVVEQNAREPRIEVSVVRSEVGRKAVPGKKVEK